jgi:hypothetical protein
LTPADFVITDIRIGEPNIGHGFDASWEIRPGGIWISRTRYTGNVEPALTGIDILFGVDAVDPRPQWTLMQDSLQLQASFDVPVARLGVRYGKPKPREDDPHRALYFNEDGTFKILQISDTHMVTGVGVCRDVMDANANILPVGEADPLTVAFIREMLDVECPDLVILTGDQLHHGIPDSQTALFKVVSPMIERKIPWTAVFGNHDAEGKFALDREFIPSLLLSSDELLVIRHRDCPRNNVSFVADDLHLHKLWDMVFG